MPLPLNQVPIFADRYPGFAVVKGAVLHRLGGQTRRLQRGESVSYRRHGTFEVVQAQDNFGRIRVTLPSGSVHEAIIPACARLTVVDGRRHIESHVPESDFGFVCPDWAKPHWDKRECTVEFCTDGSYALIDHSLNGVMIYVGRTSSEVRTWLGTQ